MNLSFIVALVVMIVGGIMYRVSFTGPKTQEIGRLMFFAGLLVVLFRLASGAALHITG